MDNEKRQKYEVLAQLLMGGTKLSLDELDDLLGLFVDLTMDVLDKRADTERLSRCHSGECSCDLSLDYGEFMRQSSSIYRKPNVLSGLWDAEKEGIVLAFPGNSRRRSN
jgi:hypothetical protein